MQVSHLKLFRARHWKEAASYEALQPDLFPQLDVAGTEGKQADRAGQGRTRQDRAGHLALKPWHAPPPSSPPV